MISSGDGSIDSSEFSVFAKKMSEDTGLSADSEAFARYDTDGDSVLNEDELDKFMKENAPPPPAGPRKDVLAAYTGSSSNADRLVELIQSLQGESNSEETDSTEETGSQNESLVQRMDLLQRISGSTTEEVPGNSIRLNLTA